MKASPNESRGDALLERLLAVLLNRWFLAAVAATFLLLVSLELANLLDEGIWEYSAWLWAVHGDPPYVGSFENKPPGIFLLYRLSYAAFGLNLWPVRILGVAAMVGTLLLLYELGRRYQGRIAGAMAALIFGLAMAHHVTDGYMLAVTEPFMVLFTALAFYLLSSVYWRRPAAKHLAFDAGGRRGPRRRALVQASRLGRRDRAGPDVLGGGGTERLAPKGFPRRSTDVVGRRRRNPAQPPAVDGRWRDACATTGTGPGKSCSAKPARSRSDCV